MLIFLFILFANTDERDNCLNQINKLEEYIKQIGKSTTGKMNQLNERLDKMQQDHEERERKMGEENTRLKHDVEAIKQEKTLIEVRFSV